MIDFESSLVTGRFFYGGTPDREVRIMQLLQTAQNL